MNLLADGGYLDLSAESLYMAHYAFVGGHPVAFCEHTATSVERIFRHHICRLFKKPNEKVFYFHGFSHDLIKMSKKLLTRKKQMFPEMTKEDIGNLLLCVGPKPNTHEEFDEEKVQDKPKDSFNKFKYPILISEEKVVIWPKNWVVRAEADSIYAATIPVIVKQLLQNGKMDTRLLSSINKTIASIPIDETPMTKEE